MHRFRYVVLTLAFCLCLLAMGTAAQACAIDQRPSAFADGRLAQINRTLPYTATAYAAWSWCIFPQTFPVGHYVVLTESRQEVAHTLEASALLHPWGWLFGDGTTAVGWTVRHAYARPGHWRIRVYAYDPAIKRWTMFDQVTIAISSR